jgi:NlpC/P60 family
MSNPFFNHFIAPLLFSTFCITSALADNPDAVIKVHDSEDNYRLGVAGIAQNYLGIPYVLGARGPRSFDCSGFTSYIFNEFGAKIYPLAAAQSQEGFSTDLQVVRAGDLVFFGKGSNISHVALVVRRDKDGITVVHCTTSRGVIVENITQSHYWSPKIRLARNVINRFFEFLPTSNSIFGNIAAPLASKVETVQQQVEQVIASTTKAVNTVSAVASASVSSAVKSTQAVESNSNVYSLQYKADQVHNAYSRTYGHVSSDEDDADADQDEGGQN